jgi:cytochrome c oxidase cbb3-type subunit II
MMKRIYWFLTIAMVLSLLLAACGTNNGDPADPASTPMVPETGPEIDAEAQALIDQGEQVYIANCSSCHQPAGEGVEGAFPALDQNPEVVAVDPSSAIHVVVHGREQMPAFGPTLSDEEIAAVVSYIRNAWGNEASIVTPEQVAEAR